MRDHMKESVKVHIQAQSAKLEQLEDESLTASWISEQFSLSRNMVSQYLNELVSDGLLIKTNTRPVYFYDRHVLEDKHDCVLEKAVYDSIEDLEKTITTRKEEDFEKLIGYRNSLRHAVEQCKASMSYPPNGLPILIHGPTGTGKSFMAQLMYEYGKHQGIISEKANFVTVNCSEYANNPELLTANLFGSKKGSYTGADSDNAGLLQVADGGVLFLDEVHCLKPECQEKLFLFMDKGIYHMLGDNETWLTSKTHLIFATTEVPEDALLKTMLRRIPLIISIPALDERPLSEKKLLIMHILREEEKRIQKCIYISNQVYQALINASYSGNVGSVKNHIKAACANAFLNDEDHETSLNIHIYNLPDDILQQSPIISTKLVDQFDMQMMDIGECEVGNYENNSLIKMYESLLKNYHKLRDTGGDFHQFLEESMHLLANYNDHVMYDMKNINNPSLDFTRKIVDKIFSIVINRYGIKINNSNILSYAKYLYEYTKSSSQICNWTDVHEEEINELISYLSSRLSREYYIAKEIIENVKLNLDIVLDNMAKMTLILNLKGYNREISLGNTICVILCHGYSTASSIADAANKLLGQYIFDGIDMQLDVSSDKITEQLNDFLKMKDRFDELVLLVDMGSLEDIYKGISRMLDCNIAIINNVSTKLALEVGSAIRKGKDIQEIMKDAASQNVCSYQYINNRKKKDAILSVCATGLGSAKKITELLLSSLPQDTPVEIVAYDYQSLVDNGINDAIFNRYQIQTIVGTMNPGIEEIPFIAVEEIILNNNIDVLYKVFSKYLDRDGIVQFSGNILKNFTLSNIVNHLTILNANKVLEDVEEVVVRMEKGLHLELSATQKVGLYMHLSCLIERLMMRSEVQAFEDIDTFCQNHENFIRVVKESFSVVESQYSVEIPVTEVAYIFNYIQAV